MVKMQLMVGVDVDEDDNDDNDDIDDNNDNYDDIDNQDGEYNNGKKALAGRSSFFFEI